MLSLQFSLLPITKTKTCTLSPNFKPLLHVQNLHCFRASPHLYRPLCATAQNVIVEENDVVNGTVADGGAPAQDVLLLPAGLRRELMPKHVAVIMDGNRRWARMRELPVWSGYEAGIRALRVLVELCCRWGIRVLTVFAFSSDNWFRPKVEVDFLMSLFEKGTKDEQDNFLRIEG
uniref:Putative Undecaprenyl pyrophosphate synthetase family protein n=1 Tax=Davidia involucrata TaxID=16924 RepID=A0A5B7C6C1_DAVIN